MEVLVVIAWLVLCGAVAVYAGNKGRSGVGFFFLSLFLSPLVGFVVAVAVSPDENKVAFTQGKKRCPECAEFVQPAAKICRFCHHNFAEEKPAEPLTEAEQLAAAGMSAGPPCPKCGSVSTFLGTEEVKASRWWRCARAPFLSCPKCGEKWQPEDSAPIESIGGSVVAASVVAAVALLMVALIVFGPKQPASNTAASPPTNANLERAIGDLGVQSGLIAHNAQELEILKHKGDRNYYEFTLQKNARTPVSTVSLQLKKVDPKKSKFTLNVIAADRTIEKKDRTLNEPLQFYTGRDHMLYELVVFTAEKNMATGYLSTPKNAPTPVTP
jgi:hypothetical protein